MTSTWQDPEDIRKAEFVTCHHCSVEFPVDPEEKQQPSKYLISCPKCGWRWFPKWSSPAIGKVYLI